FRIDFEALIDSREDRKEFRNFMVRGIADNLHKAHRTEMPNRETVHICTQCKFRSTPHEEEISLPVKIRLARRERAECLFDRIPLLFDNCKLTARSEILFDVLIRSSTVVPSMHDVQDVWGATEKFVGRPKGPVIWSVFRSGIES